MSSHFIGTRYFSRGQCYRLFLITIILSFSSPIYAEGSRELVQYGGYRPFLLAFSNNPSYGIQQKAKIRVYAKQGEEVHLGSSVSNAKVSTKDITYASPGGTQNGSCDVKDTGEGLIDTLAKEQAGPLPKAGGYQSCHFIATETGVYEIEFFSSNPTTSTTPLTPALTTYDFPLTGQAYSVAAWDVTVFKTPDDATSEQKGRVYTPYLPLSVGKGGTIGDKADIKSKVFF